MTTTSSAPRTRLTRCPHSEQDCTAQAAALLGVVAATGVPALAVCVGRQRVVWSTGRTEGPVGAWIAASVRTGSTRRGLFPGFRDRINALVRDGMPIEPFLTILPGETLPIPAQVRMTVVARTARHDPHLVLVALREYDDGHATSGPFDVAVHRRLIGDMGVEAAVTTADLRITWASPAFQARADVGSVIGRVLTEVTSAQERDAISDASRQAQQRRSGAGPFFRTLQTGRRLCVVDHRADPTVGGLLWWWQADNGAGTTTDPQRLAAIEAAVTRFIDELAWAGVDTARDQTKAVGRFAATHDLTEREREILELLTSGLRVPSIAARLFIAPSTVRNHLSTAFKKLGVGSQAEFFERVAATSTPRRTPRQRTRTARQPEP